MASLFGGDSFSLSKMNSFDTSQSEEVIVLDILLRHKERLAA